MKKLTLVMALLLAFGLVGAFAQDVAPVVDFSASAEAKFGIDLNDDLTTGFENTAEADLAIKWVDEETWANEGEGVYGWIEIEDITLGLAIDEVTDSSFDDDIYTDDDPADDADNQRGIDGSIGDINARIYFSPAYVQLSTAPGFDYNNAEPVVVADDDGDPDPADSVGSTDLLDSNGGIIIGAEGIADMLDIAFKVGSYKTFDKDYDNATGDAGAAVADTNTDNLYAFGLDATVKPMEMLSVDFGAVFSNDSDDVARTAKMGMTVNPVLTLPVMSKLVVGLPFDVAFEKDTADSISYEIAPEATLDLNEGGSNLVVKGFLWNNTEATGSILNAKVGVEEVADGFVAGLESHLNFYLFDILDATDSDLAMGYGLDFGVAYDIDGIKPYLDAKYYVQPEAVAVSGWFYSAAQYGYTVVNEDGIGDEFLNLSAGVEMKVIDNTTFDVNYSSVNLTSDVPTNGTDAGRLTFSAKVEY